MPFRSPMSAIMCAITVGLLALVLSTGPTLREFSSWLSLVCFMLLFWRIVATFGHLTSLTRALAAALASTLIAAAVAQALLAAAPHQGGPPLPSNEVGIWVVILSRVVVLVVVTQWTRWIDHYVVTPSPKHPRAT